MKKYDLARLLDQELVLSRDNDGIISTLSERIILLKKDEGKIIRHEWVKDEDAFGFILGTKITSVEPGDTTDECFISDGKHRWYVVSDLKSLIIKPVLGPM